MTVSAEFWELVAAEHTVVGPAIPRQVLAYGDTRTLDIEWNPQQFAVSAVRADDTVEAVPEQFVFSVGKDVRALKLVSG